MKTYRLVAGQFRRIGRPLVRLAPRRRGTVIIVVLALLGLLAIISFFALSFTGSANQSATYFANSPAANAVTPTTDSADSYFDDILRQIIIGSAISEKQSVLWGGNKSLLPTMYGRDLSPYNGFGVNQIWNTVTNVPTVDQNFDGIPDDGTGTQLDNRAFNFLNLSPAAAAPWQANTSYVTGSFVTPNGSATGFLYVATSGGTSNGTQPGWPTTAGSTVTDNSITWVAATSLDFNNFPKAGITYPDPDPNITYPDLTSAFLASDTLVPNGTNNPVRVITPSFHRPMLLRNAPASGGGKVIPYTWYTDATTAPLVLFPHREHLAIDSNGNLPATTVQRFVSIAHPDYLSSAPGWAANTAYTAGQMVNPSPTNQNTYVCTVPGTSGSTQPTWPTATGATVTDGTVIWSDTSLQPFPIPGDAATWGASTAYALGARVQPSPINQHIYICTTAGTSGTSQPAFTTAPGSQVADNTVVWTEWTQEGIWTWPSASGPVGTTPIQYDVDTNNDGVPDTRYIDFGFPLMTTPDGSQQFVPLGAVQIIDADALFNLNAHGNRSGLAHLPVPNNFAGGNNPEFISQSDHGVSSSEVNPEWALNARPAAASPDFSGSAAALSAALQQYTLFFRTSGSTSPIANNFDINGGTVSFELANMEWWNLLNGRPQLSAGTPPTVSGSSFAGRWGENVTRLDPNVVQILGGATLSAGVSSPSDPFPLPGTSGIDDNNNSAEGGNFTDQQNVFHPAFVQPIDFFASGSWVGGTQGKQRLLYPSLTTGSVAGAEQFPQYSQFYVAPTVQWANDLAAVLMPSGGPKQLLDEPDEQVTEPSAAAQQPNDNIFDASENLIQLQGDYSALGNPGRTASLMPFNFVANQRAALIRQRFTSTSWDLKSFGKEFLGPDTTAGAGPYDARRLWEFTDTSTGATGVGPFRFPPNFGAGGAVSYLPPPYAAVTSSTTQPTYPLRLAVANLIQVLANPNINSTATGPYTTGTLPQTNLVQPQRLLSVNGLTEMYANGNDSNGNPIYQFRFRPLTPHPSTGVSNFAKTPIAPFPPAGSSTTLPSVSWIAEPEQLATAGGTPAQQEWLARYDRQRMARDIYTTLYLMGGGADTPGQTPIAAFNYATTANQPSVTTGVRPVYTDDQLAEMAQFAVNLVDALDPDSNITIFEYDKDLSDGWNLDDNAYDGTADPIVATHPLDRGVVYGIERQQLCLNESMVTFSQPCFNTATNLAVQHPDVQWDTHRQWAMFYTELENVGPTPVSFNSAQWQIVVKQSPIMTANSAYYGTGTGTPGEMRMTLVGSAVQSASTLPTLAAGASTGGISPRLTIGGMIGSGGTAAANASITGTPFTYWNPNPSNLAVPAPSYMLVDPNDLSTNGMPTGNPMTNDYQFPIAPRAAYDNAIRPTTMTPYWFGNQSVLTPAMNGLDLIDMNQVNNYWITPPNAASPNADGTAVSNPSVAAGSQLLQFNDPAMQLLPGTAPVVLRIELRRRADLNRMAILPSDTNQMTEAADNPWITVDYMDVPVNIMALKLTATGGVNDYSTQIQGQLGGYFSPNWPSALKTAYQSGGYYQYTNVASPSPNVSTERSQPMYHDYRLNPCQPTSGTLSNGPFVATSATMYPRNGGATTLAPPLWQGNSFGEDNDAAGYNPGTISLAVAIAPHPLYQPHYDRDFSSIGELFNIPLYGQMQAPQWVPSATYTVGATILPCSGAAAGSGGLTFVCTTAGTSGATPPSWPTTAPGTVGDGGVIWTAVTSNTTGLLGNQTQMYTGLTHVMASRVLENATGLAASTSNYTPERLVGADYVSMDSTLPPFQHYVGYGTAGFRFQHPEGGNQTIVNPNSTTGTSDFTENRWFRLLGLMEVPTRSHRGINEPNGVYPYDVAAGSINGSLGFYRTPGKININTLRYPDVVAGLVGEPDIFNMNFTAALPSGQNLPANLSVPYLLQDITGDTIVVPPPQNPSSGSTVRDWWEQFIATRDGVDPLPVANGGTGLSIPGLPKSPANTVTSLTGYPANFPLGSHPFRGMNFSAYGGVDTNGYNGPLESNALRSLQGDAVTATTTAAPANFDLRRRLFELGTNAEHVASNWDYATKQRLLSRLVGNTTTRSNVFFVWIQVDFFQAKDVGPSLSPADTGVVRIGAKLGTSPAYRGFFVIDRSQALPLVTPQSLPATDPTTNKFVFSFNQSFNWQSLVLYRQRIQ